MSFNLIESPWIPVVYPDFSVEEVSLIQLFELWNDVREIRGDNPPTTLAIYRLLLAILHTAYDGPEHVKHWKQIDEDDGKMAIAYLKGQGDRFDILHPDHPFMQDPILPIDKAVPVYAIHTMSTSNVFSHEHEWSGYRISLPEAARLLVRLQGFDITSLRAFYVGQTKGNRSAVNTPSMNAANVWVQGMTKEGEISLKRSLLSNLIRYDPESSEPCELLGEKEDDRPSWETNRYAGKPNKVNPVGYIDYLTFPWRRLKLFVDDDDQVSQIAITMGNSLPAKVPVDQWECHISYKKDGKPVRLSVEKQLWRDADAFLLFTNEKMPDKAHRPSILGWVAKLKRKKLIETRNIHLQVFGLSADKAKPLTWLMERFSASMAYVMDEDGELAKALKEAIAVANKHQEVFRSFKGSPYFVLDEELKHGDAAGLSKSLDGESRYWARLDRLFETEVLKELPGDDEKGKDGVVRYGTKTQKKWMQTVQHSARSAFEESLQPIYHRKARVKALWKLEYYLAAFRKDEKSSER